MLKKQGKISKVKGQNTAIVIVPADLVKDSQFPFELPVKVQVEIKGDRLVVTEVKQDE